MRHLGARASYYLMRIISENLPSFCKVSLPWRCTNRVFFYELPAPPFLVRGFSNIYRLRSLGSHIACLTWRHTMHRGAFCQSFFRGIYYCGSNKSTRKETGKMHLCAMGWNQIWKSRFFLEPSLPLLINALFTLNQTTLLSAFMNTLIKN